MEAIWNIFTSKEEYEFELTDKFDRAITNYTVSHNLLNPTVSKYLNNQGFKPSYPNGKPFATCISHDIDVLFTKANKLQVVKSLVKLNLKTLVRQLKSMSSRVIDAKFDLNNILEIDNRYGVKASYYFLSTTKDNKEDWNYDLDEIESYFSKLEKDGHELGLHGSKLVSTDQKNFNIEKVRLEKFISKFKGYRSHYLKFEVPTTWNILAGEGITYDTTFGAASCPGFRNGMCHPFQPFDRNTNEWIDVFEIPLVAMDVSFFRYLNLDHETSFKLFQKLVQQVKKCGGVFSFLWHNNYVTGDMLKFYERCLGYLREEDTWFATGGDVIDWYKQKDYFYQQREILEKIKS